MPKTDQLGPRFYALGDQAGQRLPSHLDQYMEVHFDSFLYHSLYRTLCWDMQTSLDLGLGSALRVSLELAWNKFDQLG